MKITGIPTEEPERRNRTPGASEGSIRLSAGLPQIVEVSLRSRHSGRYTTARDGCVSYVYEASWQKMAGFLVWNCSIWRGDLLIAFRGGSAPWPATDPVGHVRTLVEAAIEETLE
jgi:hypothetical protein